MPSELQETLYVKVREFADKEVVATWIVYDKKHVVNYKKELGIARFPVMLVFNREKLLFKTNEVEELYEYFEAWLVDLKSDFRALTFLR